jgi:hypothetical protein
MNQAEEGDPSFDSRCVQVEGRVLTMVMSKEGGGEVVEA